MTHGIVTMGVCVGCGKETIWICPFCKSFGKQSISVCESPQCREKHEEIGCVRVKK